MWNVDLRPGLGFVDNFLLDSFCDSSYNPRPTSKRQFSEGEAEPCGRKIWLLCLQISDEF